MSLVGKTLKLCSCNGTLPIDAKALARSLGLAQPAVVHRELCRKEAAAFQGSLSDPDLVVACTQEAPLFSELARAAQSQARISFVNIREAAGWSADGARAGPKIAALLAAAALPEPAPVAQVDYQSAGQLLVIGPADAALDWASRLAGTLEVSVLLTGKGPGEQPGERSYAVWSGKVTSLTGWLGAFDVAWVQDNPIDLDLCTRCNACVRACPEGAIDFSYQVDLDKCKAHRACVAACGPVMAIDFARAAAPRRERFDLVLDLSREPLIGLPDLPQGYAAPGADPLEQALAAHRLVGLVGEFSKPRFTDYRERICAHGRSGKTGCTQCLDVCSTGAIRADGDHVRVETHLCAGCGGCATVCPSGAMTYAYPSMPDLGLRLKTLLTTYREAGGQDACVLVHDGEAGRGAVRGVGRRAGYAARGLGAKGAGRGLPARVLPFECFHVASIGIDFLLAAVSYGASQVVLLTTGREAEGYVAVLRRQMEIAEAVLQGLGFAGRHFDLVEAASLEASLWGLAPAATVARGATFRLSPEKRTSLDLSFEHLLRESASRTTELPLPAGAPFGAVTVNGETCTLCKACIGACPESALLDAPDAPILRFIERNCVQCGLCEQTCPEDAIRLVPRLLLGPRAKEAATLHEAEPFHCLRCGKAFGTKRMVEAMTGKLGAHSMFAGAGTLQRLQMCGDCRVVDMVDSKNEPSIFDYTGEEMSAATAQDGLAPEDAARAALYGLIARLFYAPPDQDLLAKLLHADYFDAQSREPVAVAWRALVDAARHAFPVVLENEHTELFVGTGKAEITPYLSHYTVRYATDNPLVELRQQLARWGMARRESVPEPEDHVAGICEALSCAIAVQQRSIEEQRAYFDAFVYRGATAFCDAVSISPKAVFYAHVARFARAFFDLERAALDMP